MELLYPLRHYSYKFLLTFLGPAELDEEHDPIKVEDRKYRRHIAERKLAREAERRWQMEHRHHAV